MRPTSQLLYLLLAPIFASAQQSFLPTGANGNFPACAVSCAVLQTAQTTCLTQTGQQATGLAAENCFCQSATLQGLYSTPDALCTAECPTETDRVNLRTWFMSFCAQVGQGVDPNAQSTATPSATTVVATSTGAGVPTSTDAGSNAPQQKQESNQSWIQGHWQWIVMLVVLAIGLGALAWLLVFLRNRHRRKVDEHRAQIGGFPTAREKAAGARAATPDLWGPHQHMHATKGWEYHENSGTAAAGAVPKSRSERRDRHDRSERRRSHRRSFKPGSKTRDSITEINEDHPPTARGHSSKGPRAGAVDPVQPRRDPSNSRSRSRRPPRESKYDFERDVENQ